MTDVVYILGHGSTSADAELHYSILSLHKHLKNFRNIYVVGSKPRCATLPHIHIPMPDLTACKARNIYLKILAACEHPDISDQFILFSDDVFLLQDVDAKQFPVYTCGTLLEGASQAQSAYKQIILNTSKTLTKAHLPTLNYNLHYGFPIHKKSFCAIMPQYQWDPHFGLLTKSLYANTLNLPNTHYPDVKLRGWYNETQFYESIAHKAFFTVANSWMRPGIKVLKQLYGS